MSASDSIAMAPIRWWRDPTSRLYRSTALVSAGNAVYLALGFAANLLLVRALGPAEYGLFAISAAFLIILQEVCSGGLDVAMVRYASGCPSSAAAGVYCAALQIKVLGNAALAAVLWLLAPWLARAVFHDAAADFPIQLAGLGALGSSVYTFVLASLQAQERFLAYAVQRVLNNLLKCALLGAFFVAGRLDLGSALWIATGVFAASSALGLLFLRPLLGEASHAHPHVWRGLLGFGGAVIVSRLLFTLYGRLDVLFLGHFRSAAEVAVYSVASNMTYLIDLSAYSIILAVLPQASRLASRTELRAYAGRTLRLCAVFAVPILPMVLYARPLIVLLFSQTYSESAVLFRILAIGSLATLFVHPLYLILYARNKPWLMLFADGALVLLSLAGNSLLVPPFGAVGAAAASVMARLAGCAIILLLVFVQLRQAPSCAPAATPNIAGSGQTGLDSCLEIQT